MPFTYYQFDVEIKAGDRVKYHGDPGEIEFVVTEPTGDPAMNWHLEDHPGGGVMITAKAWGGVFLHAEDIPEDEDLEFVSRAPQSST
jgi:hypothetical protein